MLVEYSKIAKMKEFKSVPKPKIGNIMIVLYCIDGSLMFAKHIPMASLQYNPIYPLLISVKEVGKVCAICGKDEGLKQCECCMSVHYCSRNCQMRHWYYHHDVGRKIEEKKKTCTIAMRTIECTCNNCIEIMSI
jgi:hypothetical protein